ncbi:MAG: hypothetical protein H8D47_05590 [Planctomycetes bacterium]|nr:hypothetical protein [Planctomycetota bacterium]MBL7106619.1 hypothetical protein [Phycisphaerae bacterium]
MARRQKKVSRKILLTWFILGGFIFLFAPYSFTSFLQGSFVHVFSLPLKIGRGISLSAQSNPKPADFVSKSKYEQLQNHLSNVIAERDLAYTKIDRLSGLRNRFTLEGAQIVAASVTMTAAKSNSDELIINRGIDDQLRCGQFVLSDNSVVGVISETWDRCAKVILSTNTKFTKAVRIEGSGSSFLMRGTGEGYALIVSKNQMPAGKNIIALPESGMLETPIVIGRITDCQRSTENPLLWNIIVKPVCESDKLTELAVVVMNPKKESGR